MSAPVLLVHGDKKTQRLLGRVVTTGHGPVRVAETVAEGRAALVGAAAVVVSAELARGDGFSALVAQASAARQPVMLCGEAGATEILTLVRDHGIDHVLSCDPVGFADELPLTLRGLACVAGDGMDTARVRSLGRIAGEAADAARARSLGRVGLDAIGLERYLSHGAPLSSIEPSSTHGRVAALSEVRDSLATMGLSARHERQAALIADELLSNAIYDAPAAAAGRAQHELPRDQDRPLSGRERPRIRWGADGRYLGVEVTDHYGAIDADTIRNHVAKLIDRSTSPRQGQGGAGLGLAMTFLAASQLVFHLDAGRVTQAIGLIDLRVRPDGIRALVPSLHIYSEPRAEERHVHS